MTYDATPCDLQDCPPPVPVGYQPGPNTSEATMTSSSLVKLEDYELNSAEVESGKALVAYSSSPPPLIKDQFKSPVSIGETTSRNEVQSLRNQFELSTYEYAALEERYHTLKAQHSDLRKLGHAFNDVIHGSSSYEDQAVSVEQLRAEAGHEGLRAKALMADMVRPIFQGAGGLQYMMTQAQSISSMIEEAGGVEELRALVAEAYMLRFRVNDVGGLAGIDQLISQVNLLQGSHQELIELKAQLDKPDGLRAKVQKYSKLQKAFYAIETGAAFDSAHTSQLDAYPLAHGAKTSVAATDQGQPTSDIAVGMNPARARLLAKAPIQDPNRDLYEPKPPVTNPCQKTGSNDVPLGPTQGGKRCQDLDSKAPRKRRHNDEERVTNVAKRPRVNIGRASALVQATLAPSNARPAPSTSNADRISTPPLDYGEEQLEVSKREDPGFLRFMEQVTSVQTDASHLPARVNKASVESLLEPSQQCNQPMIKQEDASNDLLASRTLNATPPTPTTENAGAGYVIAGFPIALWVGGKRPDNINSYDLIRADNIPPSLANFLTAEMMKHLKAPHLEMLKSMPANSGTCILRYLIDGQSSSNSVQNHRACKMCSSGRVANPRPCALLQDVKGVRTIVFVPSRDNNNQKIRWIQKQFWV